MRFLSISLLRRVALGAALTAATAAAACGGSKPAPVTPAETPTAAAAGGPGESTPPSPETAATPPATSAPETAPAEEAKPAPEAPKFEVKETAETELGTAPAGMGLKVGSKAPDGALLDITGATVKLSAIFAKGPTFVVFYRGGWCPFCNSQLHNLTEAKGEFDQRGVQLVAISVDQPGEEAKTQAKLGVPFPMLSDSQLKLHNAYKIVHKTSAEEREKLASYGVDLATYSGQPHGNFATAAIFFVDKGKIRWAHVGEDYQTRPSPKQMLAVADQLAAKK